MTNTAQHLAVFTRQLSVLIGAGLPLVHCLDILARQQTHLSFGSSLRKIRTDVETGAALADAMKKQPDVFDPLYWNLIAAGEAGGSLDTVLARLATYLEKSVKLKRQVRSALIYPAAVLLVSFAIVGGILWKVIPAFASLFDGLGARLPLPTRAVIALSEGLVAYGWVFGVLLGCAVSFVRKYSATTEGRRAFDKLFLQAPLLGPILRKAAVARFCRTLATLLGSGVPILQALDITTRGAGNAVIAEAIRRARVGIERGESFATPLGASGVFPPMMVEMVQVGESAGALDAMLGKVADFYEDEVDGDVASLLTLLEPGLVVVLGVLVGGLVIAMYLPIFDLINRVG